MSSIGPSTPRPPKRPIPRVRSRGRTRAVPEHNRFDHETIVTARAQDPGGHGRSALRAGRSRRPGTAVPRPPSAARDELGYVHATRVKRPLAFASIAARRGDPSGTGAWSGVSRVTAPMGCGGKRLKRAAPTGVHARFDQSRVLRATRPRHPVGSPAFELHIRSAPRTRTTCPADLRAGVIPAVVRRPARVADDGTHTWYD